MYLFEVCKFEKHHFLSCLLYIKIRLHKLVVGYIILTPPRDDTIRWIQSFIHMQYSIIKGGGGHFIVTLKVIIIMCLCQMT